MADTRLNIIIDAQDKASKTLKGLSGRLDKMKPALKGIAVASTAGFTALAVGVNKSVKAFQEQERAEARLAQLTKQTTGATKAQVKVLTDQASALQKVGVVGDEVAIVGQSQLATFGLTTDKIAELTPSLLDMAVATKGVNATQEDMINIGNAVGRALEGGAGALTRYGISLTEAQREQFQMANKMERATLLAQILQDNFGGLNEATRKTSEGGMKALSNSFGDMQEKIGEAFVPVLIDLANKIQPIIEKITEWASNNQEIIKQGILIVGGLLAFLAVMSTITLAMIAFNPVAMGVGLAIAGIGLAVTNVVKIVQLFQTQWDLIWSGIKITTAEIINSIIGMFESMVNFIVDSLNFAVKGLNKLISALEKVPGAKKIGISQLDLLDSVTLGRINTDSLVSPQRVAGGNSVVVTGNTFLDQEGATRMGDLLLKATSTGGAISGSGLTGF